MSKNETADLIMDTIGPRLGEFLDGFVVAGTKAGTAKKILAVKLPRATDATSSDFVGLIDAVEEWSGVHIDA